MIRAVLFDFDLTLGRPLGDMPFETRQAQLYASVGLPYDETALRQALDRRVAAIQAGRLKGPLRPQTRRELLTAYRQTLRLLGHPGDLAAAWTLYEGYARLDFVLYDDTRATLQALVAAGLRLGVISNHTRSARPVIEGVVGDLIPPTRIVISGEEGVHKPRPSLFRRGAQRVGVPMAECAYVGDNRTVDAEGAVAAGFGLGVWVDREGPPVDDLPPRVRRVTRLSEVIDAVSVPVS